MLRIPSFEDFTEEEVWRGRIRIHESVQSYISEIEELQDGFTLLTIRDNRFRFMSNQFSEDYPTRSSPAQKTKHLAGVFIWLRGDKLEDWMNCSAVYANRMAKKGLLGKDESVSAKGFVLSSTSNPDSQITSTMFGLRIQGAPEKDFKVDSKGIASFCVGSQVQSLDSRTTGTSSRTYIVISSNDQPFVAFVRRPIGIRKLICDSENIKETSVEPEKASMGDPFEEETNDLFQLKLRLLRGQITKSEFESKRSKLASA